jgi:membrane peptidoglycan carboxypeptidase
MIEGELCAAASVRGFHYPVPVTWMRRRDHNIFANAISLLICGVLAGIVVAAAAFPAIAMAGLAAKGGSDRFAELPTSLNVPTPPQITYIYASDGKTLIGTFYDENRHDISLSDIPQVMRDAIIAAEDQRFYEHNGVDVQGVLRAFVANQQSEDDSAQGASTLTMQYVRQAITYSATSPKDVLAATEQTPARKIREMRLALGLEKQLTKDQILQNYLNIAAFGHGAYGIYAASQVYFGKEPKDLTLPEAALLAGLPKAPSTNDPTTDTGKVKALERRSYVLDQMVELGMISKAQGEAADNSELKVTGAKTPRDCIATTVNHWGFFCDFFYRWWADQPEFGRDAGERISKLKSGGYRITTTLDVAVQASAKKNVEEQNPTGNRDALMIAAIEPGTGYVRAMAANRNFSLDTSQNQPSSDERKRALGIKGTFPNTTNPLMSGGGDIVGYKSGSTFKIFTMLTALEKGYPLDFTIVAKSPYQSPIYPAGIGDTGACPDRKHWCPVNASPGFMNGSRNMWTGFGRSVNTYFIPLQEKVGAENVIAMAKRLGVHFRSSKDQEVIGNNGGHLFGPFTIGVTDTVPLELANAYATVAAEGLYCEPMPVVTMLDFFGQKVTGVADPRCKQVVEPDIARAAADAAHCPVWDGGGLHKCDGATAPSDTSRTIAHPLIGKTGTADQNWTGQLVLSTKQLALAAVFADPDKAEQPHEYSKSAGLANRAAINTMRDAMAGKPSLPFTPPPNKLAFGVKVPIPNVACKSVRDATAQLKAAGFDVFVDSGQKVPSPCPADSVATTDPTGSTSKGSSVTLLLSDGTGVTPGGGGPGGGGPGGGGGGGGGGPG